MFQTLVVSVVLISIAFSSQSGAQTKPADKPKYGGRLIYGSLKDIATTNVFRNTISVDYNVRGLMFEGLTGLDKVGNVVPCLARSWEVSRDGLTYTFSLRPGVKFHNGKVLTSDDAKWSVDYLRDPKNRAYYLDQFTEVKSIEATDPLTVTFTLNRPFSPFTTMVATTRAPILPAGSQLPANAFPAGTGPFRFVEWQPAQRLTMKAFKEYWIPGVPYLDEILYRPITDDTVRTTALKAREVDLADEIPYSVVAEAAKGKPEFVIIHNDAAVRRRIVFNTRIPPFNDVRIRQAIAFAIDKKELAAAQTWGFAKPTNQRYPSTSFWFIELKDREQDLQKARALLVEAGYKDGLKVKAPVYPGPDLELTTVLKDQLKRVGIELELDMMDWAAHSKIRAEHRFTLYAAGMGARTDPNQIYYADSYSKSRQNGSGYSNPEVDEMLDRANVVLYMKARKRLYTGVLKSIQRDVPEIYLYLGPKFIGLQPHVKGFSTGFLEDRFSYMGGGLPYSWLEP
jgi:peptide/nickel transport system substrate-binding protein